MMVNFILRNIKKTFVSLDGIGTFDFWGGLEEFEKNPTRSLQQEKIILDKLYNLNRLPAGKKNFLVYQLSKKLLHWPNLPLPPPSRVKLNHS